MSTRRRYSKRSHKSKSIFDDNPTLSNRYWIPKQYHEAVMLTIKLYKSDVPFNRAVDQAFASFPNHPINRNKLAEHTLKFIANDH